MKATKSILFVVLVVGLVFSTVNMPSEEIAAEITSDSEDEDKITIKGVVVQGDPVYGVSKGNTTTIQINRRENKAYLKSITNQLERIAPGIKEGDTVQIYAEAADCATDAATSFVTIHTFDDFYIKKISDPSM